MKRLFFALWPDTQTRESLQRVNHLIRAQGLKAVRPDNYHVTLVFLGNVDDATALLLNQHIDDISVKAFELTFDQLSYWRRPRVLCLTCSRFGAEAVELAAALDEQARACGLPTDTRPYTPHLTMARHVRHTPPEINFEPVVWRAESFCLVESCSEPDGVVYRVLQQWPLGLTSQ